jgi:hypothetical protein
MEAAKTPAGRIVERFGVDALSRWTGRHRSRVHAWTWSTDKGGTGGAIPPRLRQKIIDAAREERGEALSFGDFEPQEGEAYLMEGSHAEDVQ